MKNLLLLSLLTILTACSSGGGTIPDKTYYRFAEPQQPVQHASITKINRPSALGILGSRPIVAQNATGGLVQMNHNLWLESPKVLLQNYLIKYFSLTSTQHSGNSLMVEILHLEKKQNQAVIELKFSVSNHNDEIIFSQSYRQQNSMEHNSIVDFVHAINQSLAVIVEKFRSDFP